MVLHKCILEIIRKEKERSNGNKEIALQQPRTRSFKAACNNDKEIASWQRNTRSFKTTRNDDKEIVSSQPGSQGYPAPHNDGHDDITPAKNHPHPVVYFFRKVNIRKHVIGKALSLLRSQFAKKPKNPV